MLIGGGDPFAVGSDLNQTASHPLTLLAQPFRSTCRVICENLQTWSNKTGLWIVVMTKSMICELIQAWRTSTGVDTTKKWSNSTISPKKEKEKCKPPLYSRLQACVLQYSGADIFASITYRSPSLQLLHLDDGTMYRCKMLHWPNHSYHIWQDRSCDATSISFCLRVFCGCKWIFFSS